MRDVRVFAREQLRAALDDGDATAESTVMLWQPPERVERLLEAPSRP